MFSKNGVKLIESVVKQLEDTQLKLKNGIEACLAKKNEIDIKISTLTDEALIQDSAIEKASKLAKKLQEFLS